MKSVYVSSLSHKTAQTLLLKTFWLCGIFFCVAAFTSVLQMITDEKYIKKKQYQKYVKQAAQSWPL